MKVDCRMTTELPKKETIITEVPNIRWAFNPNKEPMLVLQVNVKVRRVVEDRTTFTGTRFEDYGMTWVNVPTVRVDLNGEVVK